MVEWKRKNVFVGEIRATLKRFRIRAVEAETYAELEEAENPAGGYQWKPTGRDVVIMKITGNWRQK